MQKAYLSTLYEIGEKDSNVLLLLADSGTSYDELFKKYLPNQIYDFGIAEENMVAAASGLASCGFVPFVYTAGAFLAYRSLEFIRDDVCLQNQNVKLIGMGTGLAWSTLGPTHHTTEDLSMLRALPHLTVLTPSTPIMASKCIKAAYKHNGPVYVRLGMGGEKEFYEEDTKFLIGKNICLKDGDDITIFFSGAIIEEVSIVAEKLAQNGIVAKLVDVVSISPMDKESVIAEALSKKALVSIEEHSLIGGLGSAISDILVENSLDCKLLKIGINNSFAKGYGTYDEVRKQNQLDADSILQKIMNWMEMGKIDKL